MSLLSGVWSAEMIVRFYQGREWSETSNDGRMLHSSARLCSAELLFELTPSVYKSEKAMGLLEVD